MRALELQEFLSRLPEGTQGYAYVASMAVDKSYRRQGIALVMLEQAEQVAGNSCVPWSMIPFMLNPFFNACHVEYGNSDTCCCSEVRHHSDACTEGRGVRAGKWKQKFIALHTYDSNLAAKLLYKSAGYRELASIKPFMERRRVLMCKDL